MVQPEKEAARTTLSFQPESDAPALRQYRARLDQLPAEREKAQGAGDSQEAARLGDEMRQLEALLGGGRAGADSGERARSNVCRALNAVRAQLAKGGPDERSLAEHLRTHLDLGYECRYMQSEGRMWD
jgi:hypothetical protein